MGIDQERQQAIAVHAVEINKVTVISEANGALASDIRFGRVRHS